MALDSRWFNMTPVDHYRLHEVELTSLSQVRTKITEINAYATRRGLKVFWRGQMDHSWGLTSSLVRQVSKIVVPDDELLDKVEDRVLEESRQWIADLKLPLYSKPLSQLAYLQHHGIPTRLIDFSIDPWTAMFFATESMDHTDGRLFVLLVDASTVKDTVLSDKPWRNTRQDDLIVWDAVKAGVSFPRLAAQKGVLVVGRLPSTNPPKNAWDDLMKKQRPLLAEEVRGIMSIPFKLCSAKKIRDTGAPMGLTMRIHINKESVRRDLKGQGSGRRNSPKTSNIEHLVVYPDADGMRAYSKLLQGLSKGVLLVP